MSKICVLCQKKPKKAGKWEKTRSQYNPRVRAKQKPNLQWTKNKEGKRILACVGCFRTISKLTK